jgi:mannose-6-phosphate isomerase-like protein (cupin superfamily)
VHSVVHLPGEGELIGLGSSSSVTIKATGRDTAGSFYLGEAVIMPGYAGPPPHVHDRQHDMFYVLEGTLTLQIGDETVDLGPGSFACIPPGTVHTFSNRSEQPLRFLNFDTPAGKEDRMRDLAAAHAAGSPTSEEIIRIFSRHDWRVS